MKAAQLSLLKVDYKYILLYLVIDQCPIQVNIAPIDMD